MILHGWDGTVLLGDAAARDGFRHGKAINAADYFAASEDDDDEDQRV